MKEYYFATYFETWQTGFFEVAVFESEQDRNDWVEYRDKGSIDMDIIKEDGAERIALDGIDADRCHDIMDSCERYKDVLNDNMFWIT